MVGDLAPPTSACLLKLMHPETIKKFPHPPNLHTKLLSRMIHAQFELEYKTSNSTAINESHVQMNTLRYPSKFKLVFIHAR